MQSPISLEEEVRYLHAWFFGGDPPSVVIQRYIDANVLCFRDASSGPDAMGVIVTNRLDPEAIEYRLRLVRRGSLVTRKIQVLFYLVEVRANYYSLFVNQRPGRVVAVLALGSALVRTVWKLLKGSYLVWRYKCV